MQLKRANSLSEIVIGPAASLDTEHGIQQMLQELRVEGQVKIKRSTIPYRV
jgi:hypothetical protein